MTGELATALEALLATNIAQREQPGPALPDNWLNALLDLARKDLRAGVAMYDAHRLQRPDSAAMVQIVSLAIQRGLLTASVVEETLKSPQTNLPAQCLCEVAFDFEAAGCHAGNDHVVIVEGDATAVFDDVMLMLLAPYDKNLLERIVERFQASQACGFVLWALGTKGWLVNVGSKIHLVRSRGNEVEHLAPVGTTLSFEIREGDWLAVVREKAALIERWRTIPPRGEPKEELARLENVVKRPRTVLHARVLRDATLLESRLDRHLDSSSTFESRADLMLESATFDPAGHHHLRMAFTRDSMDDPGVAAEDVERFVAELRKDFPLLCESHSTRVVTHEEAFAIRLERVKAIVNEALRGTIGLEGQVTPVASEYHPHEIDVLVIRDDGGPDDELGAAARIQKGIARDESLRLMSWTIHVRGEYCK